MPAACGHGCRKRVKAPFCQNSTLGQWQSGSLQPQRSRLSFSEWVACVRAAGTLCLLPAPTQAGSNAALLARDTSPLLLVAVAVPPCTPQGCGGDGAGQPLPKAGVVSASELPLELSRDLCICRTEAVQPSVRKCNDLIFRRFPPPFRKGCLQFKKRSPFKTKD